MYTKDNTTYAKNLLDKLINLDMQTTGAYYSMGQILHSMFQSNLHEVLGYESFVHLVEEELSFSPSTAHGYRNMYARFRELNYNKIEALKLLNTFGITSLNRVLPKMKTKLGVRGVKTRIEEYDFHQINFTLTAKQLEEVHRALKKEGAEITDRGRVLHSTDALMAIVKEANSRKTLKKVA